MTSEVRLSLLYFVIGVLWIFVSDTLLARIFPSDSQFLTTLQTYKGWLFVMVTTALLYLLLRRDFRARRRSEQEVREREQSLRYLFLNNPRPMWIYDSQTLRFLEVNDAALKFYGYSRDEFLSFRLTDLHLREDAPRLEALAGGKPALRQPANWRHRLKHGAVIEVEVAAHELEYNGRTAVLVVVHDVSAYKRMERELRESQSFLEKAQQVAHVGSWSAGLSADEPAVWSKEVFQIFGLDEQTFDGTGRTFLSCVHPDDLEAVHKARDEAIAENKPFVVDYRIVRPDGSVRWISQQADLERTDDGKPVGFIGIAQDITERKETDRALAQLAAIVQSSEDAIISHTLDGVITSWNAGAEKMYGYSAGEVLGRNITMLFDPEHAAAAAITTQQTRRGGRIANYETVHRRKDGTPFDVAFSMSLIHSPQGDIIGVAVLIRDITGTRRLEAEALEKEKIRLALNKEIELRTLRGRFMSMISHEFRNPLAAISMTVEMIQRYASKLSDVQKQERLEQIQTQIKYLTELLDDMMDVLKTETTAPEFRPVPLDLVPLCEKLSGELALTASDAHQIAFRTSAPSVIVSGDEKLLRRAIGNLLGNALKYSPQGGRVTLELWIEDRRAGMRVKDEGIGIPEGALQHLFEAFHRAENVGKIPGTGLGLTITRQAVELHDGTLEVESREGQGTAFTMYLPLAPEQVAQNSL